MEEKRKINYFERRVIELIEPDCYRTPENTIIENGRRNALNSMLWPSDLVVIPIGVFMLWRRKKKGCVL